MSEVFRVDADMLGTIEALKPTLGAATNSEVIEKAIALAKLAGSKADQDGNLKLSSSRGQFTVNLSK